MNPKDPPVAAALAESRPVAERPLGRGREVASLGAILLAALVLWAFGAARLDFYRSMESSRALVAQQMLRTGDYVVPRRGSETYLAKPPLFYWAIVGLSELGGGRVTERTVRLASALSVLALVVVTYLSARRVVGARTALLAAAIATTTPFAFQMARDGNVDTMLALGATLSLFGAFFLLEPGPRSMRSAVLCGVGVAIGLLTKGPLVLLFLVPTVVLYAGFRRESALTRSWRAWGPYLGGAALAIWAIGVAAPSVGKLAAFGYVVPIGLLASFASRPAGGGGAAGPELAGGGGRRWLVVVGTAAALTLPWLVLAADRLGLDALVGKLGREIWVDRIAEVGSSNRGALWTYLLEIPVACMPFILFVPIALWPGYAPDASPRRRRMLLFLRCWLLGSLVLFTVVGESRRDRYLFPVLPAVALLAADAIASFRAGSLAAGAARYADRISRGIVIALGLAPLVLAFYWYRTGLGLTAGAVGSVAAATAGAAAGVVLLRTGKRCAALLASASLCLLGMTTYEAFGHTEVVNLLSSPRPGAMRFKDHVPAGETLWLADLPSYAASFYLDAAPLGALLVDPAHLARLETIYVGLDASTRDRVALPPGFGVDEVHREPIPGSELVLLRLRRARPAGG